MNTRYKVIISNRTIYKEIELSPEVESIRIGTSQECDVRLRRDFFFSPVEITLQKTMDEWNVMCSDNLYLTTGNVRKFLTRKLEHGDELQIKYQESNLDVLSLSFVIDFDYEKRDYGIEIDLNGCSQVRIGGSGQCDIVYRDEYVGNDSFVIKLNGKNPSVIDEKSTYGVFVNGIRVSKEKEIKDYDFISLAGLSVYFKGRKLYTSSSNKLSIRNLSSRPVENHSTIFSFPKFSRNTRVEYTLPSEEIEIQQPSQKPNKSKKNLVLSLVPSFVMLFMTIVVRGMMGNGGAFVIFSAVSMTMGIVMSIVSYFQEKKEYNKQYSERIESYNKYIDEKKEKIETLRKDELRVRNLIYEPLENSIDEVQHFGKRIFEKESDDADFLHIYLGKGTVESSNQVKYTKQEFIDLEDPLAQLPEETAENYRYLNNAPIIADFNNSNGVGIIGDDNSLLSALKNITLDLSIRHFYGDVKLVYVLNSEYSSKVEWIRWLHNVENSRLDIRNISNDEESKNIILEDLYAVLSVRENSLKENNETKFEERYVVFVTESSSIASHPISKYFKSAASYGFTFVFLENHEESIPQGCKELIRLKTECAGEIIKTENGDVVSDFTMKEVSDEMAESLAIKLGSIQVDEVTLEGELTKNISLFEMLNILSVEDIDLEQRWKQSMVHKSLSAPLGVKRNNEIVYLDISDKAGAHGPHGLIAGTTGSGKSEILQTYILSIATLFHPYEVGFVLIDFKGGGMANQFKDLPHLIGTITNIDGREINRSLLSIKAELVKRQEMFSENGVNHINDYIKLYKAGKVNIPLPHLIMIVDEFAELKAEHPDFMKELISAARIGRTLGVHLILATQKPSGVVDAQIWSNSKFKLCLKVQTKEDSNEVIKTPLAAEIVEPGRAYFQVGNNEIFDLFQSAYSGANVPEGNDSNESVFEIYEKNLWGKKTLRYTNKKASKKNEAMTQLQAIVNYVHDYCENHRIERLPGICLPSLADRISTNVFNYTKGMNTGIVVPIGVYDDPIQQAQGEVSLELSRDNVYIIGSAQSGKTVMLQTMIYGLLRKFTPEQVNLYLIDCGSMVLKMFEDSKHVGGVVLSNEEEKCKNLFKLLKTAVSQRKKLFSSKGVSNFATYLEAGFNDLPLMTVVIDNVAAFKEYFPHEFDDLASLTREAQGVGISFVVTATASNALSYRVQANFAKKLALNCIDTNEYGSIFGHCREIPKDNPGRGLLMMDKRILEYQTAIFGKSNKEAERNQELMNYIIQRNSEVGSSTMLIPMVPNQLNLSETMAKEPMLFRRKGILPVGMSFDDIEMASLNLETAGSLSLLGDGECKERFIANLIKMISATAVFHDLEMVIVDEKTKPLKPFDSFGVVQKYSSDISECMSLIEDFCDDVLDRANDDILPDSYKMLVINNSEAFRRVCADRNISKNLSSAIKSASELGAFILISPVENQIVSFNASEVLKTLKDERKALLFAPLAESKMFEVRSKGETSFDNTMGYLFNGNSYSKIKIFD